MNENQNGTNEVFIEGSNFQKTRVLNIIESMLTTNRNGRSYDELFNSERGYEKALEDLREILNPNEVPDK